MISAFGRFVVRDGGFEEASAAILRALFDARNQADYGAQDLGASHAEAAISDAARFVDAVEAWLGSQPG